MRTTLKAGDSSRVMMMMMMKLEDNAEGQVGTPLLPTTAADADDADEGQ